MRQPPGYEIQGILPTLPIRFCYRFPVGYTRKVLARKEVRV